MVFFNSNKKLLHVYICCARPNGRTVRYIKHKSIMFQLIKDSAKKFVCVCRMQFKNLFNYR